MSKLQVQQSLGQKQQTFDITKHTTDLIDEQNQHLYDYLIQIQQRLIKPQNYDKLINLLSKYQFRQAPKSIINIPLQSLQATNSQQLQIDQITKNLSQLHVPDNIEQTIIEFLGQLENIQSGYQSITDNINKTQKLLDSFFTQFNVNIDQQSLILQTTIRSLEINYPIRQDQKLSKDNNEVQKMIWFEENLQSLFDQIQNNTLIDQIIKAKELQNQQLAQILLQISKNAVKKLNQLLPLQFQIHIDQVTSFVFQQVMARVNQYLEDNKALNMELSQTIDFNFSNRIENMRKVQTDGQYLINSLQELIQEADPILLEASQYNSTQDFNTTIVKTQNIKQLIQQYCEISYINDIYQNYLQYYQQQNVENTSLDSQTVIVTEFCKQQVTQLFEQLDVNTQLDLDTLNGIVLLIGKYQKFIQINEQQNEFTDFQQIIQQYNELESQILNTISQYLNSTLQYREFNARDILDNELQLYNQQFLQIFIEKQLVYYQQLTDLSQSKYYQIQRIYREFRGQQEFIRKQLKKGLQVVNISKQMFQQLNISQNNQLSHKIDDLQYSINNKDISFLNTIQRQIHQLKEQILILKSEYQKYQSNIIKFDENLKKFTDQLEILSQVEQNQQYQQYCQDIHELVKVMSQNQLKSVFNKQFQQFNDRQYNIISLMSEDCYSNNDKIDKLCELLNKVENKDQYTPVLQDQYDKQNKIKQQNRSGMLSMMFQCQSGKSQQKQIYQVPEEYQQIVQLYQQVNDQMYIFKDYFLENNQVNMNRITLQFAEFDRNLDKILEEFHVLRDKFIPQQAQKIKNQFKDIITELIVQQTIQSLSKDLDDNKQTQEDIDINNQTEQKIQQLVDNLNQLLQKPFNYIQQENLQFKQLQEQQPQPQQKQLIQTKSPSSQKTPQQEVKSKVQQIIPRRTILQDQSIHSDQQEVEQQMLQFYCRFTDEKNIIKSVRVDVSSEKFTIQYDNGKQHLRTINRTITGATYNCIEIYLKSTKRVYLVFDNQNNCLQYKKKLDVIISK